MRFTDSNDAPVRATAAGTEKRKKEHIWKVRKPFTMLRSLMKSGLNIKVPINKHR